MEDSIKLKGKYTLNIFKEGIKINTIVIDNIITTVGKYGIADVLGGVDSRSLFRHIAFGDDNTAVAVGQTTLINEVGRIDVDTINVTNDLITVGGVVELGDINSYILKEIGIFGLASADTADSGTMLSRALISPTIDKISVITVTVEYQFTVS